MIDAMSMTRRISSGLLAFLMLLGGATAGQTGSSAPPPPPSAAPGAPAPAAPDAQQATPPRVSYIHGDVSFLRPGAADWAPAALNMPLAPGDILYAGPAGNVEIQIGPRAFARAAYGAQLGLDNQEPDFTQLRATSGYAALDLREMVPGQTVELATPGAAFTVDRAGYYHAEVGPDATVFRTHRGGMATITLAGNPATVTPSGGAATPVATNQQLVITGTDTPRVEATAAPGLSAWDQWNYQRSDYLAHPASARYLSAGVYGTEGLDQHGTWHTAQSYGSVWVPAGVAPDWSPYTTGRWIWDPRFGWTWLDDAPWGWAPYHYGRWVYMGSYWAWAPGPVIVRPVYAPALVVFLGGPVVVGRPLCWAPLGWGEPVIPWWGGPRFVGVAWWGGWGGPRVVNNVVVTRTTTVNVTNITVYRNVNVTNAVVGVPADRFGQGTARPVRITDRNEVRRLTPVRGALDVRPVAASVTVGTGGPAAARPPDAVRTRPVVATRAPHDATPGLRAQGLPAPAPAAASQPQPRIVPAPARVAAPPAAPIPAPGRATPAPGPARGPAGPGPAAPPNVTGRAPAPARPTVPPPAMGVPAGPAPTVAAPGPQTTPPAPAAPVARRPPPAPPAPGVQNAPAPPVRGEAKGGRQPAPPDRGPGERGGPDRTPRADR